MFRNMRGSVAVLVASTFAVGGCGGGGGGGGGGTTVPAPQNLSSAPVAQALTNYYSAAHSNTLSASDGAGNTYTIVQTYAPNTGTTTFEGQTANSAVQTVTVTRNGVSAGTSTDVVYYTPSPFAIYGDVTSNGNYTVTTLQGTVPTTITVGSTGTIDAGSTYHDSTKAVLDQQYTATYSVASDTPTTALLCLNGTTSGTTSQGTLDGLSNNTQVTCYHVDANANATLATITVNAGSTVLTFK